MYRDASLGLVVDATTVEAQVELTDHFLEHLQWWLQPQNLSQRETSHPQVAQVTLVTDASSTWGWGSFLEESGLSLLGAMVSHGQAQARQNSGPIRPRPLTQH